MCSLCASTGEREICCYENISLVMEEEEGWQEVVTLITPPARWPNTTLCVCVCVCVGVLSWMNTQGKGKAGGDFPDFLFLYAKFWLLSSHRCVKSVERKLINSRFGLRDEPFKLFIKHKVFYDMRISESVWHFCKFDPKARKTVCSLKPQIC